MATSRSAGIWPMTLKPIRGCSSMTARSSGRSGPRLAQDVVGNREVADVAQQHRVDQHIALTRLELEVAREREGVEREALGLLMEPEVPRRHGLQERAYGGVMRLVQLVVELAVVQGRARVVAERQEDVVVDLVEAARAGWRR